MQGLTAAAIDRMGDQTRRITESWRNKASSLGIDVTITSEGSVAGLAFAADPARHEDDPAGLGIAKLFHLACLNEGIAMGPVGLLALSTAIDEPAMAHLIRGWDKAFDAITEVIDSRRT